MDWAAALTMRLSTIAKVDLQTAWDEGKPHRDTLKATGQAALSQLVGYVRERLAQLEGST